MIGWVWFGLVPQMKISKQMINFATNHMPFIQKMRHTLCAIGLCEFLILGSSHSHNKLNCDSKIITILFRQKHHVFLRCLVNLTKILI